MYFLLKMVIFQAAALVYQMVIAIVASQEYILPWEAFEELANSFGLRQWMLATGGSESFRIDCCSALFRPVLRAAISMVFWSFPSKNHVSSFWCFRVPQTLVKT